MIARPWYQKEITQEYVKSILHYNPETGIFTWIKARPKINVGDIAGFLNGQGYWCVKINARRYPAHRLAIFYMTGQWPPNHTDHIDMKRANNKWENIRPATRTENFGNQTKYSNNKSGIKGVCWDKDAQKWLAQIQINNKKIKLGRYTNIDDAAKAYADAAAKYFKEFARLQ